MTAARGTVRFAAWCLALASTLVALHLLPVPTGGIDLASRDPAELLPLLLRGLRWIALAGAWYLAGATALATVTSVAAWRPLRRLDAAVTIPLVRSVVRAGLGASLAVGVGLGPSSVAVAAPGPPGASAEPAPLAELADPPTADGEGRPAPERTPAEPAPPVVAPTSVPGAAAPRSDATHEVVAGESFWSITAASLAEQLGREPEDHEVIEPWLALIEANRDRLLVPDDPDLLVPGQELRLPPALS